MTDNTQTLMDRKYHTNIYTDLAYRFIITVANGITCNGKRGIGYYTGTYMNIEREPDGEIVLSFKKDNNYSAYYSERRFYKSAFYKKHTEFLNWFGWYGMCKIKDKYPKAWIKENWKRNNTNKFTNGLFHDFDSISEELTISDIYLIYDSLRGRTKRLNGYSVKQKDKILGEPLDPITAELERARRDEIAALHEELHKKLSENRKKYNDLRSELYTEEEKNKKLIEEEYKKKVAELNDSVKLAACLTD